MGRVRDLLMVRDVFQLQARGVTPEVQEAILAAARRAGAEVISAEHPTTTLEDLFLRVVRADAAGPPARKGGKDASTPPAAAQRHG
jgi:ABC-2 type transport system ATP-binding protein